MTSPASLIPASSWRISVWFRPSTPAARHDARAASRKPGISAARRMLIEAAWSYPRFPARISREQLQRQEGVWRSRSATPRGRRKNGYVGAIASSPGQENHLQWSPPRSLENWRPLPGRSPNTFKPLTLDALRSIADITKRRSSLPTTIYPKLSQGWRHGHGQENPRVHYQPDSFRRQPLDRGSSATHHRSGGIQPAHQSMINRRFDIDRASCPAPVAAILARNRSRAAKASLVPRYLKPANMRVVKVRRWYANDDGECANTGHLPGERGRAVSRTREVVCEERSISDAVCLRNSLLARAGRRRAGQSRSRDRLRSARVDARRYCIIRFAYCRPATCRLIVGF